MATTIMGYVGFRGLEFVVGSDPSRFVLCSEPRRNMKLPFLKISIPSRKQFIGRVPWGGFRAGGNLGTS